MKAKFLAAVLVAAALVTTPVLARTGVPLVNHGDIAITTGSGKAATTAQVRLAILVGSATKGWTVADQGDGKLLATLVVRNKHTVVVNVVYSADKYLITYKDSSNMNFKDSNGTQEIHPSYDKWLRNFKDAVRIELLKV